jgi:hypothetical protein
MPTTLVIPVLAITAFASTASPLEAQTFEGVITFQSIEVDLDALGERGYEVTEALFDVSVDDILALHDSLVGRSETSAEMLVKGDMIRTPGNGSVYFTTDLRSGLHRIIQPDFGNYIEITHADQVEMLEIDGPSVEPPEVAQTGMARTINGVTATAFDVTSPGLSARVWVSRDDAELVSVFQQLAERMYMLSEGNAALPAFAVAEHGFPVLVQVLESGRYRIQRLVSLERRAVSADLFEPPAGLRRVTVQEAQERMLEALEMARDSVSGSADAPP